LSKPKLKTLLSRLDLPQILAQGIITDNLGTVYTYNQYIKITGGTLAFGSSGGDFPDPKLHISIGMNKSLYVTSVVFNKPLNLSSPDVRGQPITLFGKDYIIGSESRFDQLAKILALYSGGVSQIISEGQEVTMTVSGVSHRVKVIGVSSTTQAVISVDGVTQTVTKGQTKVINGVSVFTKDIFYFGKEGQISQVEIVLGANRIQLTDGANATTGQYGELVDGTSVSLTGTTNIGLSKLEITVAASDSSHDSIAEGSVFTDPVFGSFNLAFEKFDTGSTGTIAVDNAGTTNAILRFSDYRGNEKTITWAYTWATNFAPQLNDSSMRSYRVIEGETAYKNDYLLVAPSQESEFGHIIQYSAASSLGIPGGYVEFKDVMSGDVYRAYLEYPNYTSATLYLDGNPYYLKILSTISQAIQLTWGSGAGPGYAGADIMAFPLIRTKGGAYVTLLKSADLGNPSGLNYQLPGSTNYVRITNSSYFINNGRLQYSFGSGNGYSSRLTGINGINLSAAPAVMIYEDTGKDAANADVNDAVLVTLVDGSTPGVDMTIKMPVLTAASNSGFSGQTSDLSVSEAYDRYGVHVTYDSDSQGLAQIVNPDGQAEAKVTIGAA
jgi:hypothetical protein